MIPVTCLVMGYRGLALELGSAGRDMYDSSCHPPLKQSRNSDAEVGSTNADVKGISSTDLRCGVLQFSGRREIENVLSTSTTAQRLAQQQAWKPKPDCKSGFYKTRPWTTVVGDKDVDS